MSQRKVDPKTRVLEVLGPSIPWLRTVAYTIVGAFVVGALELALTMLRAPAGTGPALFSYEALRHLLSAGLAASIVVVLALVRDSTLPRKEWSQAEREAARAKLEAQGRLQK